MKKVYAGLVSLADELIDLKPSFIFHFWTVTANDGSSNTPFSRVKDDNHGDSFLIDAILKLLIIRISMCVKKFCKHNMAEYWFNSFTPDNYFSTVHKNADVWLTWTHNCLFSSFIHSIALYLLVYQKSYRTSDPVPHFHAGIQARVHSIMRAAFSIEKVCSGLISLVDKLIDLRSSFGFHF